MRELNHDILIHVFTHLEGKPLAVAKTVNKELRAAAAVVEGQRRDALDSLAAKSRAASARVPVSTPGFEEVCREAGAVLAKGRAISKGIPELDYAFEVEVLAWTMSRSPPKVPHDSAQFIGRIGNRATALCALAPENLTVFAQVHRWAAERCEDGKQQFGFENQAARHQVARAAFGFAAKAELGSRGDAGCSRKLFVG